MERERGNEVVTVYPLHIQQCRQARSCKLRSRLFDAPGLQEAHTYLVYFAALSLPLSQLGDWSILIWRWVLKRVTIFCQREPNKIRMEGALVQYLRVYNLAGYYWSKHLPPSCSIHMGFWCLEYLGPNRLSSYILCRSLWGRNSSLALAN